MTAIRIRDSEQRARHGAPFIRSRFTYIPQPENVTGRGKVCNIFSTYLIIIA